MNRFASLLVQLLCMLMLGLVAGLAFELVRDMRELPLYEPATWSRLLPEFGALVLFAAGVVMAEQAGHRMPHRVPGRRRRR